MNQPNPTKSAASSSRRSTLAPRVLVADDQDDIRESLRLLLKTEGFSIVTVASPNALIERIGEVEFDVVLIDLNYTRDTTSGEEGLHLLDRIQALDQELPVVVMTAWASVGLAVEAIRRGARDLVEKPWDNERLVSILRIQTEVARTLRRGVRLEAENRLLRGAPHPDLIAGSAAMAPVLELLERIGPTDANVLLTGENGTGKSLLAKALHQLSRRRTGPLITVNLGGLAETVFESELFGHVRGAFTDAKSDRVGRFELASGGTLFLDEVANIRPSQQTRLLRVLESGEFERVGSSKTLRSDARIIAATNADIEAEVAADRFRRDLLFRLKTVQIHLPPLRERSADLRPLAEHFLAQHAQRYRQPIRQLAAGALAQLREHSWPGNVRELSHVLERAVLMAAGPQIESADLGLTAASETKRLDEMTLEEAERVLIERGLERTEGNVTEAAHALGLSRSALYRRLDKLGLSASR